MMVSFLRKLFRFNIAKAAIDKHQVFIDDLNLSIGKNTDLKGLSIVIFGRVPGILNIKIGDHCNLSGSIVLYNPDAKVIIGDRVFIGHNTTVFCYKEINIESDVMISWGCTLIDTNAHSLKSNERINDVLDWSKGYQYKNWSVVESKPIHVMQRSWIGFNSIISKGVTINEGTVVAFGSVVTKSTVPFSIVGGNPAVLIKMTE
jgi:acetyltransferase-like isoleucine patch superfamily enzyme